jgi:hypothetical protein
MKTHALQVFRFQVGRLWLQALSRRSQNGRVTWDRMRRLLDRCSLLPGFIMTIPCAALVSSPKAGAGCGKPARPDLWRGFVGNHDPYFDWVITNRLV